MTRTAACEWLRDRDRQRPATGRPATPVATQGVLRGSNGSSFQSHQIRSHVVNVRVRVNGQQLPMRLQRIANIHYRTFAIATERALGTIHEFHDDVKVVE